MATILQHPNRHHIVTVRTSLQNVCIGMGHFFLAIGFIGMIVPGFLGLHLSMANNMVHIVSGALALWCGYSHNDHRSFNYCAALGSLYMILALAGFIIGEPGYPSVGFTRADQSLFRVIPSVLEFGTMDHFAHLVVSVILLVTAYAWRREIRNGQNRLVVDAQARTGIFTHDTKTIYPSDSTATTEMNVGDIDRIQKLKSAKDFEQRL